MSYPQPVHNRSQQPRPIQLTKRDFQILEAIYACDGILSLKQIDRLFFSGRGGTWPRERMRALVVNGYVNVPTAADTHHVPPGEVVYWLGRKGVELVAGLRGETAAAFRQHEKLRRRWSLIAHDLTVNDFRLAVTQATYLFPDLILQRWVPESEFWAQPDPIAYEEPSGRQRTRRVRPDGFFTIRRAAMNQPRAVEEFAFLLEIDMGTEDNPRFAREKVRPGSAYIASPVYRERFGIAYGRWLVVTTSKRRLANMKSQTEQAGGGELFYFTTFTDISSATVLTKPIWYLADHSEPTSIIPELNVTAV